MKTKIEVLEGGFFAGRYCAAGEVLELTDRELRCVLRRGRKFAETEGRITGPITDASLIAAIEPIEQSEPEPAGHTIKELKAILDEHGIDYAANARKPELQSLVDSLHG